jgi:pimeloyl-ACP methyl ester carboxylesterase
MLFARASVRGSIGLRAFSTARVSRTELAYQVYGPENDQAATRDPILFLHGLFGSKQNNRSISKYVRDRPAEEELLANI